MNFDDELMMNKWEKNTTDEQIRLERLERSKGVYFQDHDCIAMLCFKVVLQLVFFF